MPLGNHHRLLQRRAGHLAVRPEVRGHGSDTSTRLEALDLPERLEGLRRAEEVGLGEGLGANLEAEGSGDEVVVADGATALANGAGAISAITAVTSRSIVARLLPALVEPLTGLVELLQTATPTAAAPSNATLSRR